MDLDNLISRAIKLKEESYKSSSKDIWEEDAKEYIKISYGDKFVKIFERTLFPGRMAMNEAHAQSMHVGRMEEVIKFLEELKTREPQPSVVEESSEKKVEEDKKAIKQRFGSATFHGPVTFGDNSPASQVTVGEFISALTEEIHKQPDSPQKKTLLKNIDSITKNPTFSGIASSTIGNLLTKLFG